MNKHTAKITPLDIKSPKKNNFINKTSRAANHFKYIIGYQAFLCVNRLYLLKPQKCIQWSAYCYTFLAIAVCLYALFDDNNYSATYLMFKCTSAVEFLLLVFTSTFLKRDTLREFFKNIDDFDETLRIEKDIGITTPRHRSLFWISLSLLITVGENFVLVTSKGTVLITTLAVIVHDSEQTFFCTLLRAILTRVRIVKAHVAKVCNDDAGDMKKNERNKVDALSKNVQLDVSSLHEVYESLHKCSEMLNSAMNLPMVTMLLSSGLSTIVLLKYTFSVFQEDDLTDMHRSFLFYSSIRCLKYTSLVIVPCYYSSITTAQVAAIRTILHDALNNTKFDRIECRKLKAFFQLTRDSEFAYALWGVINLNMSLPLSYTSLCTTYLVIIIQFSKFID